MKIHLIPLALALTLAPVSVISCKEQGSGIKKMEKVAVEAPQGTAPQLPYQLSVTLADGRREWRQVKWDNFLRETEEEQAALPEGSV